MRAVSGAEPRRAPGPWFRRRPSVAVAVALLLFALVLVLRLRSGTAVDALALLASLPIALLAITLGLRAGLLGGLVGVGLLVTWVVLDHIHLSALGWAARIAPMLLLGVLLGQATDRLAAAERERRRFELAAMRHREAVEINDTVVQNLSAAKWSLEAGHHDKGLELLNETLTTAQAIVSDLLRDADAVADDIPPRRSWARPPRSRRGA